jgi:hypothetical protein
MKSESERTRTICKEIRDRGWVALTIVGGNDRQTPGLPDRWFACCDAEYHTWHGWIEFKNPDGILLADQKLLLKKLVTIDETCAFVACYDYFDGGPIQLKTYSGRVLGETKIESGVELLELLLRLYG